MYLCVEGLKLQRNVEHYVILQTESNQPTQSETEDKNLFMYTRTALDVLGFSIEDVVNIFRVIAIILKLGNLQFVPCNNIDGTEGCVIDNDYGTLLNVFVISTCFDLYLLTELYEICELLGAEHRWLQRALTTRHVEDGILTDLSVNDAIRIRNILCKTLYNRLFKWLINKINDVIRVSHL